MTSSELFFISSEIMVFWTISGEMKSDHIAQIRWIMETNFGDNS